MSLFPFNRQSVFLTPTPLFFALTGKRCRKLLMESTRDSGDFGGVRPAQSRTALGARIPHAPHITWAHASDLMTTDFPERQSRNQNQSSWATDGTRIENGKGNVSYSFGK